MIHLLSIYNFIDKLDDCDKPQLVYLDNNKLKRISIDNTKAQAMLNSQAPNVVGVYNELIKPGQLRADIRQAMADMKNAIRPA